MAPSSPLTLLAATADAMKALGAALGRLMGPGHVLALSGALGAGKTTFCQGLAQGLDVPSDRAVASPTFSLVNIHPGRLPFVHADLYRLKSDAELEELGFDELLDDNAVAIEWAERFATVLPADHLKLSLFAEPNASRVLVAEAQGPRSQALLRAWGQATGQSTSA